MNTFTTRQPGSRSTVSASPWSCRVWVATYYVTVRTSPVRTVTKRTSTMAPAVDFTTAPVASWKHRFRFQHNMALGISTRSVSFCLHVSYLAAAEMIRLHMLTTFSTQIKHCENSMVLQNFHFYAFFALQRLFHQLAVLVRRHLRLLRHHKQLRHQRWRLQALNCCRRQLHQLKRRRPPTMKRHRLQALLLVSACLHQFS